MPRSTTCVPAIAWTLRSPFCSLFRIARSLQATLVKGCYPHLVKIFSSTGNASNLFGGREARNMVAQGNALGSKLKARPGRSRHQLHVGEDIHASPDRLSGSRHD